MERQMSKRNYFLKTLTILFLSILLLLPTLMLEGKEAKAAAVTETRAVDLSKGNVEDIRDDEVIRVYQTTQSTSNYLVVNAKRATVILDNLNIVQGAGRSPMTIVANSDVKILLKGSNKMVQTKSTSCGFYMEDGVICTIDDYGNGDGSLDVSNSTVDSKNVVLGASVQSHATLTINSGVVKAKTVGMGPAIGATAGNDNPGGSTLDLIINGGTVEARTEGWGAAIGTQGDVPENQENTVNVTINGGKVIGDNHSKDTQDSRPGRVRGGATIGTGYGGYSKQNVKLNIPEDSTAELDLISAYGGAAIGGSGSWNSGSTDPGLNTNTGTHENIIANIEGGNTKISVQGQAPGIGIGAGVAF